MPVHHFGSLYILHRLATISAISPWHFLTLEVAAGGWTRIPQESTGSLYCRYRCITAKQLIKYLAFIILGVIVIVIIIFLWYFCFCRWEGHFLNLIWCQLFDEQFGLGDQVDQHLGFLWWGSCPHLCY